LQSQARALFSRNINLIDLQRVSQIDKSFNPIGEETNLSTLPPSLAIVIHVFHLDQFKNILKKVTRLGVNFDAFVTCSNPYIWPEVQKLSEEFSNLVDVKLTENRGRNFGPWLIEFHEQLQKYEYFVHLHTKKSAHVRPRLSDDWSARSMAFIENKAVFDRAINILRRQPDVGLIFVDCGDLFRQINSYWNANYDAAVMLVKTLGLGSLLPRNQKVIYPMGGMFLARTSSLKELLDHRWTPEMFPIEKGQLDGTTQHAIERLVGWIPKEKGMSICVYKPSADTFYVN